MKNPLICTIDHKTGLHQVHNILQTGNFYLESLRTSKGWQILLVIETETDKVIHKFINSAPINYERASF